MVQPRIFSQDMPQQFPFWSSIPIMSYQQQPWQQQQRFSPIFGGQSSYQQQLPISYMPISGFQQMPSSSQYFGTYQQMPPLMSSSFQQMPSSQYLSGYQPIQYPLRQSPTFQTQQFPTSQVFGQQYASRFQPVTTTIPFASQPYQTAQNMPMQSTIPIQQQQQPIGTSTSNLQQGQQQQQQQQRSYYWPQTQTTRSTMTSPLTTPVQATMQ
jgi:hypothetical protein